MTSATLILDGRQDKRYPHIRMSQPPLSTRHLCNCNATFRGSAREPESCLCPYSTSEQSRLAREDRHSWGHGYVPFCYLAHHAMVIFELVVFHMFVSRKVLPLQLSDVTRISVTRGHTFILPHDIILLGCGAQCSQRYYENKYLVTMVQLESLTSRCILHPRCLGQLAFKTPNFMHI